MTVTFKIQGEKKGIILKAIIYETTECSSMKLSSLGVEHQKFIKWLACEMMSPHIFEPITATTLRLAVFLINKIMNSFVIWSQETTLKVI